MTSVQPDRVRSGQSSQFTAAVVDEFGPNLNVRDVDLPKPGLNQALVKLIASGVCRSRPSFRGMRESGR